MKYSPERLLIVLIILCSSHLCLAQENLDGSALYKMIRGVIIDDITQQSIPFAHVFIKNSSTGTYTDVSGVFAIKGLQTTYELVISHVGYMKKILLIDPSKQTNFHILLEPSKNQLEEIVITGKKDNSREKHLKLFKDSFLGVSSFAQLCEITNPNILHFKSDNKSLRAKTASPLIIENMATGYTMEYHLESFEIDLKSNLPRYLGYSFFIEKETSNYAQKRKWRKNREKAYKGSLEHFVKSVLQDRIKKEGFRVDNKRAISVNLDPYEKKHLIYMHDEIRVKYLREYESAAYQQGSTMSSSAEIYKTAAQTSIIKAFDYVIKVDKNFQILNLSRILQKGYMGWERTAESLPVEYKL